MTTQEARAERSTISQHPVLFTAAVLLGAALVAGAVMLVGFFSDSEEAPIRVKNGSLELILLTSSQKWAQDGNSGNFRVDGGARFKDEFEVTVAVRTGATCGGMVAAGSDIVLTYDNDKEVRLQSQSRNTWVKPGQGVSLTWAANAPQRLTYAVTGGYIKRIAVGNGGNPTPMCSFTAANQLEHILILNIP